MSGYLARLVDRSRGDLATVQPRLSNRFEELPTGDLEVLDGEETTAPLAAESRVFDEAVDSPDRELLAQPSLPESPTMAEPEIMPSPQEPAVTRLSSPLIDPPSLPAEAPTFSMPTPSLPEAFPRNQSPVELQDSVRGTLEPRPLASPPDGQATQHSPDTPMVESDFEDSPSPTLEAPTVTSITVNEVRSSEPAVVEVRIGRIDIHAAPPTTTSAPPRRPARPVRTPQVSLDDYLRRRKEG